MIDYQSLRGARTIGHQSINIYKVQLPQYGGAWLENGSSRHLRFGHTAQGDVTGWAALSSEMKATGERGPICLLSLIAHRAGFLFRDGET